MTDQTYNYYSILIGIVILIVTTWYAWLTRNIMKSSNKTYELSRKSTITEIHNRFQSSMRDIQLKYPVTINNNAEGIDNSTERNIRLYWYLVLDEFLTCKILSTDPEMNSLWDKHYLIGVQSALKLKYFYIEIAKMLDGGSSLLGVQVQFEKEIIKANGGLKPSLTNFDKK